MLKAGFTVKGLNGISANLTQLQDVLGDKQAGSPIRNALYKAARSIKKRAVSNARAIDRPETPEKIYLNVAVRAMKYPQRAGGDVGYRIGILGGARDYSAYGELKSLNQNNPGLDTWYWRLVEFGTERTQAKPFLVPAMNEGAGEAMEIFAAELRKEVEKAVGRLR